MFSAQEEGLRFHPTLLTEAAIAQVQQRTLRSVLQLFARRAVLPEEATELMLGWDHSGGFSLHAEVWVASWDRAGLERLLRYCARPIFAGGGKLFTAILRDITERKRTEEVVRENKQRLRADLDAMRRLHKLATLVVPDGHLEPMLEEIVDAAIAISSTDFGNIQILEAKSQDLRITAQRGFPAW